jgi:hypothetical protein
MDKAGWKVVRERGGELQSAVVLGPWNCTYAVNQRVTGHAGTPVLAFSTRKAAREFRFWEGHRVFKALLENPRLQRYIAFPWELGGFEDFWTNLRGPSRFAPEGTLACDSITLLEPA